MSSAPQTRRVVPLPRIWPIRASDLLALAVGNGALILAMWVRHGGLQDLGSLSAQFTAVGQLTALFGTYVALIQIVLMSRSPWLDQLFGMERLAGWHRWLGFSCLWLLVGHSVFTTVGYALGDGNGLVGETWALLTTYPYVLMAWAGLGLFVLVAVTSVRIARRRLSYETWFYVHLYAYVAVALAFAHQLAVGTDFMSDPAAEAYWVGLYLVVIASILVFRIGAPLRLSLRHRLRVAGVTPEGEGVVSVYVSGRQLDQLPVRAGQYFLWRFLAGNGWWHAHPFSISAAPNGEYLRLTIKVMGDDTSLLQAIRPGTRVVVEGPYGAFTGARRRKARVLLIAGGIGVTPLRAMLEELPAPRGGLSLLYRASSWDDVVFRDELDVLMKLREASVHYLIGRRADLRADPLGPAGLLALVSDIRERDVFVSGPAGMNEHVRQSLRALGVPPGQVHSERFAY